MGDEFLLEHRGCYQKLNVEDGKGSETSMKIFAINVRDGLTRERM